MFKRLSSAFTAGAIGGFVNGIAVWLFGVMGISTALGVALHPALTTKWLYPRIVWGGIWGFLFLLPFMKKSLFLRGLLYSLGPTVVQLFIVFPNSGKGVYGLALGVFTPVVVIVFNLIWGVAAAFWYATAEE